MADAGRLFAHRLWLLFGYALAALLIVLAVTTTLIRLLPHTELTRTLVEQQAEMLLGAPVHLRGLGLHLQGIHAVITLHEVDLLDRDSRQPLLHLRQARVIIDLPATLRHRRPISRDLILRGARLRIEREVDGQLLLAGIEGQPATRPGGRRDNILTSLPRVRIEESVIEWRDHKAAGQDASFHLDSLQMVSHAGRSQLHARVRPPAEWGGEIELAGTLYGDPSRSTEWNASLYTRLEGLQPQPWLALIGPSERENTPQVSAGKLDLQLWSDFGSGGVDDVLAEARLRGAVVQGGGPELALEHLSARGRWQRLADGWQLHVERIVVDSGDGPTPPSHLALSGETDGTIVVNADRIELSAVAALSRLLPLPELAHEAIGQSRPRGSVALLTGHWRPARNKLSQLGEYRMQAAIHELHSEPWQQIPGIGRLSGLFHFDNHGGQLELSGHGTHLDFPLLFRDPLRLDDLAGRLHWQHETDGIRLSATQLSAHNPDIRGSGSLELLVPLPLQQRPPVIALDVSFHDAVAARVSHYLPAVIMPPETVKWLDSAFSTGQQEGEGRLTLHGPLRGFPYRDGEGLFEVRFRTTGMALDYQPGWHQGSDSTTPATGWPALRNVSGEVVFTGPGMLIRGDSGEILGSRLATTEVAIADFEDPILTLRGEVDGPLADVVRVLRDGPLHEQLGSGLAELDPAGESHLALALDIPLAGRLAEQHPLRIDARLQLDGTQLGLQRSNLTLGDLRGELLYRNQRLQGRDLRASLLGGIARIEVDADAERGLQLNARGGLTASALNQWFGVDDSVSPLRGASDWRGQLQIPPGGTPTLDLNSTLEGVEIDLTPPFGKSAAGSRPFHLHVELEGYPDRLLRIGYADQLSAALKLHDDNGVGRLERGAIHFGSARARLPDALELHLSGSLDGVSLRDWRQLRRLLAPATLDAADGQVSAGRRPPPITLQMERLAIVDETSESATTTDTTRLDPHRFPLLRGRIEHLLWKGRDLGRLEIETTPAPRGIVVRRIALHAQPYRLDLRGDWLTGEDGQTTRITGQLHSSDLGESLTRWGFKELISGASAEIEGELSWPGAPQDFALAQLDGQLSLRARNGQLSEVSPGAGRLLGLFSINMLPRRLLFDFHDLFSSGLRFDRLDGDLRLDDGNLHTDNLALTGPTADIYIAGRTGLAHRDYDQLAIVVPHAAATLPLAGGLALGPQAGALLLVLQRLFQRQIEEASQVHYRITGSWDDPLIERVDPVLP